MATNCPVCGDAVEHEQRERPADQAASPGGRTAPNTTLDVAGLCAGEADAQWDRICHRATIDGDADEPTAVLDVFYHYIGDDS
jgi:hypothetical protein